MPIKFTSFASKRSAELRQIAGRGISMLAIRHQGVMKKVVSTKGTGRIYVKKSGRRHQASAPGFPPTVDTGHYRRSIQVDLSRVNDTPPLARTGTNVVYGPRLEFGGGKVAPRPHWIPTINRLAPEYHKSFQRFMRAATKALYGT